MGQTSSNKRLYRDLLKHSGIYGLGYMLSRLTAFVLLPVYTHYLSPADYGCIALLDLTAALVGVVLASGIQPAVNRFHFMATDEQGQAEVWWTGLAILAGTAAVVVVPSLLFSRLLSDLTLGPQELKGDLFISLALITLGLNTVGTLLESYAQTRKWSVTFLMLSVSRLSLNAGLNVSLLAFFRLGVLGILIGNLITAVLMNILLLLMFMRYAGKPRFRLETARGLWAFGLPLVATGLMMLLMTQSDRFFLRIYGNLSEVGIYSLAYALGHGINTLIFLPFSMSWGPIRFEIAERPDSRRIYCEVFHAFMSGMILVLLAFSLSSRFLLSLVAGPEFMPAADLIPIISLAVGFSISMDFLALPAALHKQTYRMVPASLIAMLVNLSANFLLIPHFGMSGAAWALVLTFLVRAIVGHALAIRIEPIGYRILPLLGLLLVAVAVFVTSEKLRSSGWGSWGYHAFGGTAWCCLAFFVLGPSARRLLATYRQKKHWEDPQVAPLTAGTVEVMKLVR